MRQRRWNGRTASKAALILAVGLALLTPSSAHRASAEPGPADDPKPKRQNRLAKETSPYLLLHASNPVDWYPWGPEAFAKAKAEDKPIFLSIGYSACYWCHVMERQCFTDEAIAKSLNERFVCIKVDREERPDVDQVYMTALLAFGNGGGWPMSMFLTSDGRPFFGGTYFPPKDDNGREGFPSILQRVAEAWRDHRAELERDANSLSDFVRKASSRALDRERVPLTRSLATKGRTQLAGEFDPEHGGFGFDPNSPRRPKFPEPSNLIFLLDQARRDSAAKQPAVTLTSPLANQAVTAPAAMVLSSLDHMARGGIRDQLGGGYHRYSTDRAWLVPHFEKMLYDNAQLASTHLLAFEATADARWRPEAEATFAFVARSMTSPEGGFYSSLDAETDGEEGQSYVWTRDEIQRLLGDGEPYKIFAQVYGVDLAPNFEKNRYVLFEPSPRAEQAKALGMTPETLEAKLAPLRAKLLAARNKRPAPACDDKILTAWNGLMIAAYADGFRVLKDDRYRQAAERAADFLLAKLRTPDGGLLRTYRAGVAKLPAYLEDHAFLAHGLLRLHAATRDPRRLAQAKDLTDRMLARFTDAKDGGFFDTADNQESLLARPKTPYDQAIPSGNSVAVRNLVTLAALTGEKRYLDAAERTLNAFSPVLAQNPAGAPLMLVALEEYLDARAVPKTEPTAQPPADAVSAVDAAVTAEASVDPAARLEAGRDISVTIRLMIKNGWHIYANVPGSEIVKPTVVSLSPDQPMRLTTVDYPVGNFTAQVLAGEEKVRVYEGKVTLTAHVQLEQAAKSAPASLSFKVRYQACNDRACLAPATLTVPVKLSAGSP